MKYLYSLIKFVPDPIRGESVNLGAIVGSDATREWDMRLVSNRRRAICLDDAKAMPGIAEVVARIEEDIEAVENGRTSPVSERWLKSLAVDYRHVLQFSEPTPMSAPSAPDALDLIFGHLVVDPARAERGFRTKHRALAATRWAYFQEDVPADAVAEKAQVRAEGYTGKLDFVVHNGRALQIAQSWSFELPNQEELTEEIHSWAWVAEAIRRGAGVAVLPDGRKVEVSRDIDLGVVYIPPQPNQRAPAFAEALQAFEVLGANAVPWDNAQDLARQASLLLTAARHHEAER